MEMNKSMKRLVSILVTVLALLLAGAAQAASLQHFDGKPGAIDDYAGKGKWLVVMIWASDCHVCNEEVENYDFFHDAHKNKDAAVLGISIDGQAKIQDAREFVARHQVSFPNLIGEPGDVAQMFYELTGVTWVGTPTFLIYKPSGKLVVQQIGAVPVDLIESFIKRNS
jgi:peroxiredoxin